MRGTTAKTEPNSTVVTSVEGRISQPCTKLFFIPNYLLLCSLEHFSICNEIDHFQNVCLYQ